MKIKKVPKMISTKDLAYLEDIFKWNFNASKQINSCGGKVKIEEVLNCLEEAKCMHSDHCKKLVDILGGKYE